MSIANTNTNTSRMSIENTDISGAFKYNLKDEELYLESYLKRTTAFSIERRSRQDGDAYDANATVTAPSNDDDDDDDDHGTDSNRTNINGNNEDDFVGRRVYCCNTSRSLYCPECCRVLIPNKFLPKRFIREQQQQRPRQPPQYNATSTNCAHFSSSSSRTGGCRRQRQRRLQSSTSCSSSSSSSPFPFQSLDIVLGVKERRTSSTGIQLMCISKMISESMEEPSKSEPSSSSSNTSYHSSTGNYQDDYGCIDKIINDDDDGRSSTTTSTDKNSNSKSNKYGNEWWRNTTLYDLNRGDILPRYDSSNSNSVPDEHDNHDNRDEGTYTGGTYVLFPQEGKSVPISSVAHKIKKLVVLDIKWTRSYNVRLFSADHHKTATSTSTTTVLPGDGDGDGDEKTTTATTKINPLSSLEDLPFVHLEFPPQKSHFWRWHNRGDGMLSTIEAIYFAAREASVSLAARHQHELQQQKRGCVDVDVDDIDGDSDSDGNTDDDSNDDDEWQRQESFLPILWLFALQRSIVGQRSIQEGRPVAFSEEAKALARALRKQHQQQDPAAAGVRGVDH